MNTSFNLTIGSSSEFETTVKNTSIIGCIILFIIASYCASLYTKIEDDIVINNKQSLNKIDAIEVAFSSLLGINWPFVIFFIGCLLLIILWLLYLLTSKDAVVVEVSEPYAKGFYYILTILAIIGMDCIIIYILNNYIDYKNKIESLADNYDPKVVSDTVKKNVIMFVGISLLLIAITIFFITKL